jgi:hypothetical protein
MRWLMTLGERSRPDAPTYAECPGPNGARAVALVERLRPALPHPAGVAEPVTPRGLRRLVRDVRRSAGPAVQAVVRHRLHRRGLPPRRQAPRPGRRSADQVAREVGTHCRAAPHTEYAGGLARLADPIAALVIAVVAVKEGRDAWQGKGCCAVPAAAAAPSAETDGCGCRPGYDCCG